MIKSSNIELKYFQDIRHEYQWFVLYEFAVSDRLLFDKSDQEILRDIITSDILNKSLYHNEKGGIGIDIKGLREIFLRPFKFDKIEMSDFQFIESKTDFQKWVIKFRTEGWEDDREDAQILIDRAVKELWSRTNLNDGVWHLSKEEFEEGSNKLIEEHWIYLHFETFIEIDRTNALIRTFDFGYD